MQSSDNSTGSHIWRDGRRQHVRAGGVMLETLCLGHPPSEAPTLVLMHEGLGCIDMWRDFPAALARETGWGVLCYSRDGFGRSETGVRPRSNEYHYDEVRSTLPQLLSAFAVSQFALLGHSDGGTMSGLYAAQHDDARLRGVVMMAPHFFAETITQDGIRAAKAAYENSDLRDRLGKYHDQVDQVFFDWCDAWLDGHFATWDITSELARISAPVLAIQGRDDQYGTLRQIDVVAELSSGEVQLEKLRECRHAPHFDKADETTRLVAKFLRRHA